MNESVTRSNLARWLEPASIELTPERLAELADVVAKLESSIDGHELEAVRAAHGDLSDRARAWAAGVLGETAPTVNPQDATDLLERLLAAAVMQNLGDSDSGVRCAFAVRSAHFLGLTPLIDDLPPRAAKTLASAGRRARERAEIEPAIATSALGSLPEAREPDEETVEEIRAEDLADDVAAHARSLQSLVNALDLAFDVLAAHQAALDEEVEMLWWALRGTDDRGTAFSDLEPAVRAVSAAGELADRTHAMPGPPSAAFLLGRVLGDAAGNEITLADLADAVSKRHRPLVVSNDPLLGLSSAAAEQIRQGAVKTDATWRTVVGRTLGIDLSSKTTLAAGAQQVYREYLLQRLLRADA